MCLIGICFFRGALEWGSESGREGCGKDEVRRKKDEIDTFHRRVGLILAFGIGSLFSSLSISHGCGHRSTYPPCQDFLGSGIFSFSMSSTYSVYSMTRVRPSPRSSSGAFQA
jgi:hypothetical protein